MCCTHSHSVQSTSGLVMTCGHLIDKAFEFECMQASISKQCPSFHGSVGWEKSNGHLGLVAKSSTTSPWLIG